jgi:hypothetical protein
VGGRFVVEERSFSSFLCVSGPPMVEGKRFRGLFAVLFENMAGVWVRKEKGKGQRRWF